MKILTAILILSALTFSGCESTHIPGTLTGNVSPQTIDDIASCDSGISSSMSLDLKLEIDKILKSGGGLTTKMMDSVGGSYASKMPASDARLAAEDFRKCIDKRRLERRSEDLLRCKSAWKCDMNTVAGVCTCGKVVAESAAQRGWNEVKEAQTYKEMCGPGIASISSCWPAGLMDQERARCEVVLQQELVMPKFDSGTCRIS